MKLITLTLVILCGIAALVGAQTDPLIGTWKLNVAKSKYTPGPPAKEQTITYAAVPNGLKATVTGVDGNGNKMAYSYTAYFDGKDVAETGAGTPNGADTVGGFKRVNASTTESISKKAGKVVQRTRRVVSKDGKTLTITSTGTNEKGQATNTVTVYEKQ